MVPLSKEDILKANGTYNRSHGKVTAEKFLTGGFYDPMDIIQVKYEMLREASESPHRNITELASSYGFSRASFYKIKEAYEKNGVQALVPGKSGPRQAHKLTVEYRFFIDDHPKGNKAPPAEGKGADAQQADDRTLPKQKKKLLMRESIAAFSLRVPLYCMKLPTTGKSGSIMTGPPVMIRPEKHT